jgi:hypothetical protein
MPRPSLKDSLMAALSKGSHIETAEKIARGLTPIPEEEPLPSSDITPNKTIEEERNSPIENDDEIPSSIENKKHPAVSDLNEEIKRNALKTFKPTSDRLTDKPSDGQTVKQSDGQTVIPYDGRTVKRSNGQTVRQSNTQIHIQEYQTPPQTVPFDVLNLSFNQATILEFLLSKTNGLTNYAEINATTNITMPSARDAIARLVSRGFMAKPQTYRSAVYQGMSFVLNKSLCDIFLSAGGLARDRYQTMHQTVQPSDSPTVKPFNRQTDISSSIVSQPTTIPPQTLIPSDSHTITPSDTNNIRPSDGFVLSGPEMGYWLDTGLQERQALAWCKEFDIPGDQMRQQLSWARWDLVENKKEEGVQNTINWLYGVLRRTGGCYPRPDNYLSPEERRLRDLEVEAKRRQEARDKISQAELDLEFQKILDNPKGSPYQKLLMQLNDFEKQSTGKVFEMGLRRVFQASKELKK